MFRCETRVRTWLWEVAVVSVVVLYFGSFPWRDHPIATDVRCFLYYAARTAAGAWPHLDYFENKMPLAFFAGAGLYRVGELLGIEPFYAVRLGYVGLAVLNAWLAYVVHAHVWRSRMAGLLGLAPYLAVPILGGLPAIGNLPKLVMALCASAAALLAARRAWYAVGALGGLALLDWQVGGLVVAAGCAAAILSGGERRWTACLQVALGSLAPFLVLLALYALKGGLGPLLDQTVGASFSRGMATVGHQGIVADWPRRFRMILGSPLSHAAVAALAVPGLLLQGRVGLRGGSAALPATVVLCLYHGGVMAFSLLDFQAYGDLFILYNSFAFCAGTALCWLLRAALAVAPRLPSPLRLLPYTSVVLLGLGLTQVWVSRASVRIVPRPPGAALTLDDQRALANRLGPLFLNHRVAVFGPAELLMFTRSKNPVPPVYWNYATHAYFRRTAEEGMGETLRRIVAEASCDFVVCDREFPEGRCAEGLGTFPHWAEATAGGYGVDIYDVRERVGSARP